MYCSEYSSPLGTLLLTCNQNGLTGIWFDRLVPPGAEGDHPILQNTRNWLDAYFRGDAAAVSVPLAPEGTAFQRRVWEILESIPYGETKTYGEIANQIAREQGREKMSAQAVGQAVGKNPISIMIPCHRVVGSGGKLTGYASGLEKKIWLLRHEGVATLAE